MLRVVIERELLCACQQIPTVLGFDLIALRPACSRAIVSFGINAEEYIFNYFTGGTCIHAYSFKAVISVTEAGINTDRHALTKASVVC